MNGMMRHKCGVYKLSALLLIIGGLNWGLVGVFGYNLVTELLGGIAYAERTVYVLVGLSALSYVAHLYGLCGSCKKMMGGDCKDGACEMHGEAKGPAMQGKM